MSAGPSGTGDAVLAAKEELDRFAEALAAHSDLTVLTLQALAGEGDHTDRTIAHRAHKALLDVTRLACDGPPPDRETWSLALQGDRHTRLHELASRFARWRHQAYGRSVGDRNVFLEAHGATSVALRVLVTRARRALEGLPGDRPGVLRRVHEPSAPLYDRLRSPLYVPPWPLAGRALLQAGAGVISGVWPSYYHLYVLAEPNAPGGSAAALEAVASALPTLGRELFTNPSPQGVAARCRPVLLPPDALEPLLASCWLNKPFKYDDLLHERGSVAGIDVDAVRPPPATLMLAMAREALTQIALGLRFEPRRAGAEQVARTFLRLARLRLALVHGTLAVPLAATPRVYTETCPGEEAWIATVVGDAAGGASAEDVYWKHYARVRRLVGATLEQLAVDGR